MDTPESSGRVLPGNFCCVVVATPDLRRAFFYAETGLMPHSTTVKLILLSKLIIDGYPSY